MLNGKPAFWEPFDLNSNSVFNRVQLCFPPDLFEVPSSRGLPVRFPELRGGAEELKASPHRPGLRLLAPSLPINLTHQPYCKLMQRHVPFLPRWRSVCQSSCLGWFWSIAVLFFRLQRILVHCLGLQYPVSNTQDWVSGRYPLIYFLNDHFHIIGLQLCDGWYFFGDRLLYSCDWLFSLREAF